MILNYSRPFITDEDIKKVSEVLKGSQITQGPIVKLFEERIAKMFNVKHVVSCNSGTAALLMAYKSLGLGPGKGLITSPITFVATANAAKLCNAPVHFADVDPVSGMMNLETIKSAVKEADFDVHAISLVHLGGRVSELTSIREYANSINAFLIEDACHAPGATYRDNFGKEFLVGSCKHSDVSTFSLHAIKHFTTGEGGLLLTNSDKVANLSKLIRSHGINQDKNNINFEEDNPNQYEMECVGFNFRLSDINSALGLSQLDRFKINLQRREEIATRYYHNLSSIDNLILPDLDKNKIERHAWHLFTLLIDFRKINKRRCFIMEKLRKFKVESQIHYRPLYKHNQYKNSLRNNKFEGSEDYYSKCLSIPMYYGLEDKDIDYISDTIKSLIIS